MGYDTMVQSMSPPFLRERRKGLAGGDALRAGGSGAAAVADGVGRGVAQAAGAAAMVRDGALTVSLAELPRGVVAIVSGILSPSLAEDRDLVLRLIEIGFVPGERVRVVAQGFPGHEPIAVRLGGTTFALRRFEADYIRVVPETSPHPS